jgi:hypothetical protein
MARTLRRDKGEILCATTPLSIAQSVSIALGVSIAQHATAECPPSRGARSECDTGPGDLARHNTAGNVPTPGAR